MATETEKLIAQLERILPGLENSNSAAEDAMIRALPEVIAALSRMDSALEEISERHVPDQPAANDVPEADYIRSQYTELRLIARRARTGEGSQ